MRNLRYLNGVLTLIAVLLTLNLWTAWTASPGGEVLSMTDSSRAAGLGSGAALQKQTVEELEKVNKNLSKVEAVLSGGNLTVKVEGLKKGEE